MGIFQVGVILGGNCPGRSYPGWEVSLVGIFQVGIFRVGVFLVPKDASTKSDQNITKDL